MRMCPEDNALVCSSGYIVAIAILRNLYFDILTQDITDVSAQDLRELTLVMTWVILSYLAVLSVFSNLWGLFRKWWKILQVPYLFQGGQEQRLC